LTITESVFGVVTLTQDSSNKKNKRQGSGFLAHSGHYTTLARRHLYWGSGRLTNYNIAYSALSHASAIHRS
jgi:hypothetical protein